MSLKRYNRSFKQGSCHLNEIFLFDFLSYLLVSVLYSDKYRKGNVPSGVPYFASNVFCSVHM